MRAAADQKQARRGRAGFTLLELLITTAILVSVSGIVMSGLREMAMVQGTLQNRTEMHASVRSATELLQQEIGQAGRVALATSTGTTTLTSAVTAAGTASPTIGSAAGMFVGEQLVIDSGANPPPPSPTDPREKRL